MIRRYKELSDVKNNKAEFTLKFEFDHNKLKKVISEKTEPYNKEAENASLVRHSGEFIITDDVTGVKVDTDATTAEVEKALGDGWDGSSQKLDAVVEETKAAHTSDELKQVTDLLGGYSTDYSSSSSNRIANIANGASLVDETVVYPGDTFSFLNHVTPFTAANGYYQATGYSGGRVVPSTGGGICQVSTTLYVAVLKAELEVTERYSHSMIVHYVDPSMDAAIAEGLKDLKFINNTDAPIYIEASADGSTLHFAIYGHETRDPNRTVRYESETTNTEDPTPSLTEDANASFGTIEQTSYGYQGSTARLWKIVNDNGNETKEQVNSSTYRMTSDVYTVGTKTDNAAARAEMQAAIAANDLAKAKEVAAKYSQSSSSSSSSEKKEDSNDDSDSDGTEKTDDSSNTEKTEDDED